MQIKITLTAEEVKESIRRYLISKAFDIDIEIERLDLDDQGYELPQLVVFCTPKPIGEQK